MRTEWSERGLQNAGWAATSLICGICTPTTRQTSTTCIAMLNGSIYLYLLVSAIMQGCGVQEWDSYDRVFQRPRQIEDWGHHREPGEGGIQL